jgi:hypothetical protein
LRRGDASPGRDCPQLINNQPINHQPNTSQRKLFAQYPPQITPEDPVKASCRPRKVKISHLSSLYHYQKKLK